MPTRAIVQETRTCGGSRYTHTFSFAAATRSGLRVTKAREHDEEEEEEEKADPDLDERNDRQGTAAAEFYDALNRPPRYSELEGFRPGASRRRHRRHRRNRTSAERPFQPKKSGEDRERENGKRKKKRNSLFMLARFDWTEPSCRRRAFAFVCLFAFRSESFPRRELSGVRQGGRRGSARELVHDADIGARARTHAQRPFSGLFVWPPFSLPWLSLSVPFSFFIFPRTRSWLCESSLYPRGWDAEGGMGRLELGRRSGETATPGIPK